MTDSLEQFDGNEEPHLADDPLVDETSEQTADEGDEESEYEEISSEEVDRVIETLEELMTGVDSENIRAYLEEAADNIFSLVYDDDAEVIDDDESDSPEDLAA